LIIVRNPKKLRTKILEKCFVSKMERLGEELWNILLKKEEKLE